METETTWISISFSLLTCSFLNNFVSGIETPFISSWYFMELSGESPIVIPHPLNELPVKVDVQVKVIHGGMEYIFPGLGSAQRDDDIATDYGGVGYIYNELDVKIYVPVAQNNGNGQGWVITTGGSLYSGPFVGAFTTCEVRIRAWKISDWPNPNYYLTTTISTSSPYVNVAHNLGVYPDFVTVQLILSSGYVSEAQGTTPVTFNHGDKWINTCGTVFGITDSHVTLWGASEADDFIACFKDGWGSEDISYTSATVEIRAWILTLTEILQNDKYTYDQNNGVLNSQVPLTSLFDAEFHLLVVETKDNTVPSGRMFYGAGTASQGDAGESFGGTLYGYNSSHVLLWTPALSYGYPIYVGGVWAGGTDSLQSSSVDVSVKVIATGTVPQVGCSSPPSISNGYYVVTNDSAVYHCNTGYMANQTNNIVYCNNSQWDHISLRCEEMMCPTPTEIPNAIEISNGTQNGSVTLYSCLTGYVGNSGSRFISCNGTHWSDTNFRCTGTSFTSCGIPTAIPHAYFDVENRTATYYCHDGYTANETNTSITCVNGLWGQPTLSCLNISCSDPPEIQNAMKLSDGLENGSSTLYTCMPGFTSNNGQPKISCNESKWTSTNFTCLSSEIKPCDVPPSIPNAYYTLGNTTATYHCYHGYTGNQTDSTIRCVNSQWEATTLYCSNKTCGPPSDIPNTVKVSDGFYNGSLTIYSCLPGFSSNNEYPNTTCNGSHWSSVQFACSVSDSKCDLPRTVPNAYYVIDNNTATYHCYHGYTGNQTNNTIRCVNSHWESITLSCSNISCGLPSDIANTVRVSDGFHNGSMTIYSCLPGFSSNDEYPNTTCDGSHWSSVRFACSESTCEFPNSIPNAYYVIDNNTATYHCYHGYTGNQTDNTIRCLNFQWETITLSCSNISCGPPPDILNTVKVSDGFYNGSMTVYSCLPGFSSNNEYPNTTCNGSHWSSVQFACSVSESTCELPPEIPNAYYIIDNNTATYHCYHGYIGNQTNNTVRCLNSKWENITLSCASKSFKNISCGPPSDIPNTIKVSDGFHNGSMTIYSCLPGFSSNDEYPNTTCNGSHWSSVQFACSVSKSTCELPHSVPNAYYTVDNNTATYHCNHGYIGNQTNTTVRCVNSQWESITLSCSNFSCGTPPDILNTVKLPDGYYKGSMTIYSCLPGFSSNNEYPNATCNGSHWSSVQFACSEQACSYPPDVANAFKVTDGFSNGSTTSYMCMSGYIANGAIPVISCNGTHWTKTLFSCSRHVEANLTTNDTAIAYALEGLKIPRKKTTTYNRSLNCASDSRPSVQAIGAVGLVVISLFVLLIILTDCVSFYQKRRLRNIKKKTKMSDT